jgi:hypothetical protein
MTDSTNEQPAEFKTPSYYAYHVRTRENAKTSWNRIGSAWIHADGKGINIRLDTVPVDGRISLRTPKANVK